MRSLLITKARACVYYIIRNTKLSDHTGTINTKWRYASFDRIKPRSQSRVDIKNWQETTVRSSNAISLLEYDAGTTYTFLAKRFDVVIKVDVLPACAFLVGITGETRKRGRLEGWDDATNVQGESERLLENLRGWYTRVKAKICKRQNGTMIESSPFSVRIAVSSWRWFSCGHRYGVGFYMEFRETFE